MPTQLVQAWYQAFKVPASHEGDGITFPKNSQKRRLESGSSPLILHEAR